MGSSVLQIFCVVSRGGLDEYAVFNLTLEKVDLHVYLLDGPIMLIGCNWQHSLATDAVYCCERFAVVDASFTSVSLYRQSRLEPTVCVLLEHEPRFDDFLPLRYAGNEYQVIYCMAG